MTQDGPFQTYTAAQQNLQRLNLIRALVLLGQLFGLAYFSLINPIGLPSASIVLVMAIYASITVASQLRSRRAPTITDREFFIHLLVDIFFFSALLYFSGGASNPFISYFLIPISIAAITLQRRYAISTAIVALLSYSLLLQYYVPIASLEPDAIGHGAHRLQEAGSNLHILGMWANFALSAIIITYFIRNMANTLKTQQQALARQREVQLRDEQLLAVGTLAAGTAHELGTPLNTIKLLVDEMKAEAQYPGGDLQLLDQQISLCKSTLKQLLMTAEQSQSSELQPQLLTTYFSGLLERWQLMRPTVEANIIMANTEQLGYFHPTIDQSIINLLNNAADASPKAVDIEISWESTAATISIRDQGPGIRTAQMEELGQAFVSDKGDGLGLGLFLSQASLTRFGGTLSLQSNPQGGTTTQITLPLQANSTGDNL
jgi:two-component system sensor histidine kinase RegB